MTRVLDNIAGLLVNYRRVALVFLAVATIGATLLAVRVRFDFTPQAIFAGHNDLLDFAEEFKQVFGYEDAILLVVVEATGDRDLLAPELLTWQAELSAELKKLPRVVRVEGVSTLKTLHAHLIGRKKLTAGPMIPTLPVDEETAAKVRHNINESLADGALISHDRRAGVILVCLDPAARDIEAMRAAVRAVRKTVERQPPPRDCQVSYSGLPAVRVDIVDDLIADQMFFLPIVGVVFFVMLWVLFRSPSGAILPLLATGSGLAMSVAAMTVFDASFNIISNIIPVLLLIFGVSSCVHIVNRYAEEMNRVNGDRVLATRRAIAHMILPCFLTYFTTSQGFFSLVAAKSETLQAFGWQAAIGMMVLYVVSMAVFAALLPVMRPPSFGRTRDEAPTGVANWASIAGHWIARRPYATLATAIGVVLVSAWCSRDLMINSHMIETYDDDHRVIRTMQLVESRLGGFIPLEISLQTDDGKRFITPATYNAVAAAQQAAAKLPGVLLTRSYVDVNQEIYAKTRMRDELHEKLPRDDDDGRRRILRTDSTCRQFADALGYDYFITRDRSHARILIRMQDIGTRRTLQVIEALEARLAELFPADGGIRVALTGDAYINAKAMDGFIRNLFQSLLFASLQIFGIIAFLFWSLRVGIIAVIPNTVPLAVTLGYIGLRGYDLNVGNVIVFSISLGVTVDNTIHFISRFLEEIGQDQDVPEAIYRSYQGTGRAIVLSGALIVVGLGVMLFSDFVPTRHFAELTAVTMAAALVGDLMILPACLSLFWQRRRPAVETASAAPTPEPLEVG